MPVNLCSVKCAVYPALGVIYNKLYLENFENLLKEVEIEHDTIAYKDSYYKYHIILTQASPSFDGFVSRISPKAEADVVYEKWCLLD